ncbi:MAG TPA: cellulase family glycosylhydrolase, partial [Tepidisphaeraceae bacterium]
MRLIWIATVVLMSAVSARAQWTAELSYDATVTVKYDGASVVRMKYIAWGSEWAFATVRTTLGTREGNAWPITGDIVKLNAVLGGEIVDKGESLEITYRTRVDKASTGNVGGGIQFDLRLDKQVFPALAEDPKISDDGKAWSWTPIAGQTVTARFDNLPGDVYFERKNVSKPRAFFVPADLTPGERVTTMTLTLPPGGRRVDGAGKFYGKQDERTWVMNTLDYRYSPVDLSYLNDKPAGARGFVKAVGDRFEFADGTPARFWGCNVMAYALFNAKNEAIEQQAKRIAALGYNLVRLHHHDSADWVSPNVFAKDASDTQQLDPQALDRIDYWVKCLKDNGVYVWMDLHVGRPFREGDNVPGFEELTLNAKTKNRQAKGFNYVSPRLTQLMKDFATEYLTRTNRYTNVKYVDEPAVMGLLVTNENDLTKHFGTNFLPDKNRPFHAKLFNAMQNRVIKERGLNASKAWQTWLPGESKVMLNEIEHAWASDFVAHLRGIGVKIPIAVGNTWGSMPLSSLPSLTAGDILDVHSYGQAESLSSNPKYDDMSTHWIAAGQVVNMPTTITEWNSEYPTRDRFTQPLFMAATAAFQGWDAPMIYGYSQSPLATLARLEQFSTASDPSITALMPAAALIFRQQLVKPAEKTVVFAPPGDSLLLGDI